VCNANLIKGKHAGVPTFFTEVPGVVVGQAQHIEAGITKVFCIPGGAAKQVTQGRVLADLGRFAAVHQHALEIAKGDLGPGQVDAGLGKLTFSVVIGQPVSRKIGSNHHVAHSGDGDWRFGRRRWGCRFRYDFCHRGGNYSLGNGGGFFFYWCGTACDPGAQRQGQD